MIRDTGDCGTIACTHNLVHLQTWLMASIVSLCNILWTHMHPVDTGQANTNIFSEQIFPPDPNPKCWLHAPASVVLVFANFNPERIISNFGEGGLGVEVGGASIHTNQRSS